jgi:pimeloyl-ACP methyl ester carboxylesterase
MMRLWFGVLALLVFTTHGAVAHLALKPCHPGGLKQEIRCGTLIVPENRAKPQGRKLALEVVVVPARKPSGKEPIFFLSGGPGQAATDKAAGFARQPFTDDNDLVLVNFRGTGRATRLDCPQGGTDAQPQNYMEPLFHEGTAYAACAKELSKRADLTQYTTDAAMEDLEDARKALGYGKIDLLGGSYGTRAAIVYIHRHGQKVRAAILSGVVPFSNRSPLYHAAAAERAFEILAKQCADDPACHRAFPDPKADLDVILARLKAHPAKVTIKHPKTGKPLTVTLNASGFGDGLRVMLYDEGMGRRVPLLLKRARAGDYRPFAQLAMEQGRGMALDIATGLLASVECGEDTDRIRPEEVAKETAGSFIGDYRVRGQMAACSVWPKAQLASDYDTPYRSGVPVLLISGNLDPVTPPRWGAEAATYFPNGLHIVVPGAHVSDSPCLDSIMKQFLKTARAKGLDTSCIATAKLPPFVISDQGRPQPP